MSEGDRKKFPVLSLCKLLGKTRQSYYKGNSDKELLKGVREQSALDFAKSVREKDRGIGTVKIWHMFKKEDQGELSIGRDKFVRVLTENNLGIRRRRLRPRTTDSRHGLPLYPNLVRDLIPKRPNQLWVSDITYWPTGLKEETFYYISFITDAYTHEIVAAELSHGLTSKAPLRALKKALERLPKQTEGLIHHSDRGTQYASLKYVRELKKHKVMVSMTECGDPRENAIAERINGIIKNEILGGEPAGSFEEALVKLERAVRFYNEDRPHMSCGMLSPVEAAQATDPLLKHWHSYREAALTSASSG